MSKINLIILSILILPALALLQGCTSSHRSIYNRYYPNAPNAYKAPGPINDPWQPYIQAAANRFNIPEHWIRAVIQQESGGHQYRNGQPITSSAGAMGLMQLMPTTYADMQQRFNLGSDPFEPYDNIMAGSGYLKVLYDKYGAPSFLAAYNAGPIALENYLNYGRTLPRETRNYVAAITPHLGDYAPLTGPLARYGTKFQRQGHYSPTQHYIAQKSVSNPGNNKQPAAAPHLESLLAAYAAHYGDWTIQIGAFSNLGQARYAATVARQADFKMLQGTRIVTQQVKKSRIILWRSRLQGLSEKNARQSCRNLRIKGLGCTPIAPGH
ncbi:lytic transglycosylase domain-containing protein [Aristophania vespae]|uniref:lytic transglycosylase domain-containing protein n=1 Tax=Aristophania vespae TaxID=2697033 RepID=UPI0023513C18|nr:transglycosylase SLT domain-containing protein [Aristophania vespae]UMM64209.1 hypothetical protein DM15PD_12100 [Aristophania vespae]